MWSISAPASVASRTWSPRRSNRADKIEGAILMAIEARKEAAWNKISLPVTHAAREGRLGFCLGPVERREFGDDLHPADEGHRLHYVSGVTAEPRFGRKPRSAALIASQAQDGSLAIGRRQAVHRRHGDPDWDGRERSRGGRHVLEHPGVQPHPDWLGRVERVPEPERS